MILIVPNMDLQNGWNERNPKFHFLFLKLNEDITLGVGSCNFINGFFIGKFEYYSKRHYIKVSLMLRGTCMFLWSHLLDGLEPDCRLQRRKI